MFGLFQAFLSSPFFIAVSTAVLLKIFWDNWNGPWKNAPPGPFFIPVMGSMMSFGFYGLEAIQFPLLVIGAIQKKYGDVTRITMGSQHCVFISGLDAIKEYTTKEETTLRPHNPTLLEMYSDGEDLGMGIGKGGEQWKEMRRFTSKALKDLGAGRKGMDQKVLNEVLYTIEDIKHKMTQGNSKTSSSTDSKSGKLKRVDLYFDLPDLNVMWGLVAAKRYDYDNKVAHKQFEYLKSFLGEPTAGPITAVPWLKHIPPFQWIYNGIRESMNAFRIMIKDVIKDQKETFDPLEPRSYIDKFMVEQEEKKGKYFNEKNLIICCQVKNWFWLFALKV